MWCAVWLCGWEVRWEVGDGRWVVGGGRGRPWAFVPAVMAVVTNG